MHIEVCTTFDWPTVPELYVSQTPVFNAGAYGVDAPFIVLHSAALELLDDDEVRVLLAHELGHVISGHAFYRTIAAILFLVSASALPGSPASPCCRFASRFSSGRANRSCRVTAPACSVARIPLCRRACS